MLNQTNAKKFCCEDISLIENYNIALNDSEQIYDVHHRLETELNVSRQYLIDNNLYYNRPSSELIFLSHSEHASLHSKNRTFTDEQRKHMSEVQRGRTFTYEHRKHMSEAQIEYYKIHDSPNKGKHHSEETKQKLSDYFKGKPNIKNKGCNNGMYGKPAPNRRPINQCDLEGNIIMTWNSTKELYNNLHISLREVINCCKNRRKTFKNYIWEYA